MSPVNILSSLKRVSPLGLRETQRDKRWTQDTELDNLEQNVEVWGLLTQRVCPNLLLERNVVWGTAPSHPLG